MGYGVAECGELYSDYTEGNVQVEYEILAYDPLFEKVMLELTSEKSTYDIIVEDYLTGDFLKNDWLLNLDAYIADPDLPKPNWDNVVTTVQHIVRFNGTHFGTGSIYGMTLSTLAMEMGINTELFIENGIVDGEGNPKPPETWEEFFDVCETLTKDTDEDGVVDQFGVVIPMGHWDPVTCVFYGVQASGDPIISIPGELPLQTDYYMFSPPPEQATSECVLEQRILS